MTIEENTALAGQTFTIRIKQVIYYDVPVRSYATLEEARDYVEEMLERGDGDLLDMWEVDSAPFELDVED